MAHHSFSWDFFYRIGVHFRAFAHAAKSMQRAVVVDIKRGWKLFAGGRAMIEYHTGTNAKALDNTVNCVGIISPPHLTSVLFR